MQITGLTKRYGDFLLDHVSFGVPTGSIVGLIGENGAGKSTTIRGVLGMIHKEAGRIALLGQDTETMDPSLKEKVGVVLGDCNFSEELTPLRLSKVLRDVYSGWDQAYFETLLTQLHVPQNKKIKGLSRGTKMKLSIAAAMAHHPQLLILDEATSGLDPVVRDDILDLFLDFVQDERNSILVSSHITSDLEKVADYIVFLHEGRVVQRMCCWSAAVSSNAAQNSLQKSKERISLPAASGTMSIRCWSGMGNRPSKNTRKPCWCPRHWMRSCCCM